VGDPDAAVGAARAALGLIVGVRQTGRAGRTAQPAAVATGDAGAGILALDELRGIVADAQVLEVHGMWRGAGGGQHGEDDQGGEGAEVPHGGHAGAAGMARAVVVVVVVVVRCGRWSGVDAGLAPSAWT